MLKRTITIQKLNNIVISRLQNPRVSIINDKQQHITSQDWVILSNDFGTFLTTPIPNKTLQALCFHISTLGYFKDGVPHFEDIIDMDNLTLSLSAGLDCRLEQEDEREEKEDNGCLKDMDFKEEVVKKKNKRTKRKKTQLTIFCARVQPNSYYPESALPCPPLMPRFQFQLSCLMPMSHS